MNDEPNNDPLWIINGEIARRRKEYEGKIEELQKVVGDLRDQLNMIISDKDTKLKEAESSYSKLIDEEKMVFELRKKENEDNYKKKIEKIENKLIADQLLEQKEFEEEISQLMEENQTIIMEMNEPSIIMTSIDMLIQPFVDSVEFDKERIEELTHEIDLLTNPKYVQNKRDKFRKNGKITPLDKSIKAAKLQISDLKLDYSIKAQKYEQKIQNLEDLLIHQRKKYAREIKLMNDRILTAKIRTDEMKQKHKESMRKLQFKMVQLTKPTKMKTSIINNANKYEQMAIEQEESNQIFRKKLEKRRLVYLNLSDENKAFKLKLRKREFHLLSPKSKIIPQYSSYIAQSRNSFQSEF